MSEKVDWALIDTQKERETEMKDRGVSRVRDALDKALEGKRLFETDGARLYSTAFFEETTKNISQWKKGVIGGKAWRRSSSTLLVEDLEPEVIAFIVVRELMSTRAPQPSIELTLSIGGILEDECRLRKFEKENKGAFKWVQGQIKARKLSKYIQQRMFYMTVMRHKGIEWVAWTKEQKASLGLTLVTLAYNKGKSPIEKITVRRGIKTYVKFKLRDDTYDKILELTEKMGISSPMLTPMVTEPAPWERVDGKGPYAFMQIPLVCGWMDDTYDVRKSEHQALLRKADLTQTFQALGVLDSTPFAVNKPVLNVLKHVYNNDLGVAGLPTSMKPTPPERPKHLVRGTPEHKDWRKKQRMWHDQQAQLDGVRSLIHRAIAVAEPLANGKPFYVPHQLDFRGRVYPAPIDFQEQGADYVRALFQFAKGKKVSKTGMRWLRIHGANMYGKDKLPLDEREQWAKDNTELAKRVAKDPLGNLADWVDADKPFQFLAWCFDYVGALKGKPSHIRVSMDGTCNGLQHLSALLKDPRGARSVNLMPGPKPNDIYQDVADRVIEKLKADGSDIATQWIQFGIDRKTTKRSVMVMPYGGKFRSTLQYTEEWYHGKKKQDVFGDKENEAVTLLAKAIFDSTREIILGGKLVMDWLQQVAKIASEHGVHLWWPTPVGFVASQKYVKQRQKKIQIRALNKTAHNVLQLPTKEINPTASVNSIAPNFVHSLDASAMMLTVLRCHDDYGVDSFHMVHDDFGTHAEDTEALFHTLREVFVEMYSKDLLNEFRKHVNKLLPVRVPLPPEPLGFDIRQVLESDYFFS